MDPSGLLQPQWAQIGALLTSLTLMLCSVIMFAFFMLIGHIWIPSMTGTVEIHPAFQKVRPILYFLSFVSISSAVFFFYRMITFMAVLKTFWPDFWI
tara:strand:- start:264 stop:554 length:291 start_codon:yes stop_codon:yes gene_type:complete